MNPFNYHWEQLPNGPKLAVAQLPNAECSAASIHIPAGSRDDPNRHAGLAHFLEHMVFKGTPHHKARELSLLIENVGGQINACTSEDQTSYDLRSEAEHIGTLLGVVCEMLWESDFPEAEIQLEREVIDEEIIMYRENPGDHISDLLAKAMWGDQSLGHSISGDDQSIQQIRRPELRQFRDSHYLREDLVIAVAGPHHFDQVRDLIAPMLPGNFLRPDSCSRSARCRFTPTHITENRRSDQLQLAIAWQTPGRHDEQRHALRLLSLMLGESSSSRLFQELREERGLCYQIGSDLNLYEEIGALEVLAGLDPDGREEALECIHAQLTQLALDGPHGGELDRAKRIAITSAKLSLETGAAIANWIGEGLLYHQRIPSTREWIEKIQAVTDRQIIEAAEMIRSQGSPALAEIRGE
ncbi:MAG: M16 family metallopeptidase [Luteolibacter sp.]